MAPGCTEFGLVVQDDEAGLPILDITSLRFEAALSRAGAVAPGVCRRADRRKSEERTMRLSVRQAAIRRCCDRCRDGPSAGDGGPHFRFSKAILLSVDCADQDEVDELR